MILTYFTPKLIILKFIEKFENGLENDDFEPKIALFDPKWSKSEVYPPKLLKFVYLKLTDVTESFKRGFLTFLDIFGSKKVDF